MTAGSDELRARDRAWRAEEKLKTQALLAALSETFAGDVSRADSESSLLVFKTFAAAKQAFQMLREGDTYQKIGIRSLALRIEGIHVSVWMRPRPAFEDGGCVADDGSISLGEPEGFCVSEDDPLFDARPKGRARSLRHCRTCLERRCAASTCRT
jgi:hypothetical protein